MPQILLTDSVAQIYVLCVAPWLIAGWFRLPHYVHGLREANYELGSYTAWYTKSENAYIVKFMVIIGVFLTLPFPCSIPGFLMVPTIQNPLLAGVVYTAIFLIALAIAPSSKHKIQGISPTERTIRILITTFFLQPVIPFIVAWLVGNTHGFFFDPRNSPESMILFSSGLFYLWAFSFCLVMGPITYFLTRYFVILATIVNWPIDLAYILNRQRLKKA